MARCVTPGVPPKPLCPRMSEQVLYVRFQVSLIIICGELFWERFDFTTIVVGLQKKKMKKKKKKKQRQAAGYKTRCKNYKDANRTEFVPPQLPGHSLLSSLVPCSCGGTNSVRLASLWFLHSFCILQPTFECSRLCEPNASSPSS